MLSKSCPRRDIIHSNSDNTFDKTLDSLAQDDDSNKQTANFLVVLVFLYYCDRPVLTNLIFVKTVIAIVFLVVLVFATGWEWP